MSRCVSSPNEADVCDITRDLEYTVCLRSLDPFYIVSYYIKWVKTSGTYSTIDFFCNARGS